MTDDLYQMMADEVDNAIGIKDPAIVNQMEKDKYQLMADEIDMVNIKNKKEMSFGDTSWGKTVITGLKNIPSTSPAFASERLEFIWEAISTLGIKPAMNIKDIGIGMLKTGILRMYESPGLFGSEKGPITLDPNKMAQNKHLNIIMAMEKYFEDTYGTEENLKRYIATKPLEALEDLTGVFMIAGKATGLKKLEKWASKFEPTNVLLKTATYPIMRPFKNLPESLHAKALKIAETIPARKMKNMLDVSIKDKLGMTTESLDKAVQQIQELQRTKINLLKKIDSNKTINLEETFRELDDYVKQMLLTSSEGKKVKLGVEQMKKNMRWALNEYEEGKKSLSVLELESRKERFGKEIDKYYDKLYTISEALPFNDEIIAIINKTQKNIIEEIAPVAKLMEFEKLSKKLVKKYFPYLKEISIDQINELQGALIELKKIIRTETRKLSYGPYFNFKVGQKAATITYAGTIFGGVIGFGSGIDITAITAGLGGALGFAIGTLDSSPRLKMAFGNLIDTARGIGIVTQPNATLIRLGIYKPNDYTKIPYETEEGEKRGKFIITK